MRACMFAFLLAASLWAGATSMAAMRCARDPHGPEDEAAALRASAGRVSRDGGLLRLTTTAGPIEFRDTECGEKIPSSADCRKYNLVADLPDHGFYVVSASYYEGGVYHLVDANTGRDTELQGFPQFAPDGARFVTVTGDDPYMFNGVEVWRVSATGPSREARYAPRYEAPGITSYCFEQWIDPRHVALRGTRWRGHDPGDEEFVLERFEAVLVHAGRHWIVKRKR